MEAQHHQLMGSSTHGSPIRAIPAL